MKSQRGQAHRVVYLVRDGKGEERLALSNVTGEDRLQHVLRQMSFGQKFQKARLVKHKDIVSFIDQGSSQGDSGLAKGPLDGIAAENLARVSGKVGAMSDTETKFVARAESLPPPVVHRLPLDALRSILRAGELLSTREIHRANPSHQGRVVTPQVENILFGAYDCIFVTVGPPGGQKKYGESAISIDFGKAEGLWATPYTGWGFLERNTRDAVALKHKVRDGDLNAIGPDLVRAYADGIHTRATLGRYMALSAVRRLREKPEAARSELYAKLDAARDGDAFWSVVSVDVGLSLEGKIPARVSGAAFKAIHVPPASAGEFEAWKKANARSLTVIGEPTGP